MEIRKSSIFLSDLISLDQRIASFEYLDFGQEQIDEYEPRESTISDSENYFTFKHSSLNREERINDFTNELEVSSEQILEFRRTGRFFLSFEQFLSQS